MVVKNVHACGIVYGSYYKADQSFWQGKLWSTAIQEIPHFIEPEESYPVHRFLPLVCILSQMNPIHALSSYSLPTSTRKVTNLVIMQSILDATGCCTPPDIDVPV